MRAMTLMVLLLALPQAAWAQLFEISSTSEQGIAGFGGAAGYDPVHDCYFVAGPTESSSGLTGRFLSRSGATLGSVTIDPEPPLEGWGPAAVAYSSDISDGAGGFGGFVVVWPSRRSVTAQRVIFPGRLIGSRVTIGAIPSALATRIGLAYAPEGRLFIAVVGVVADTRNFPTSLVRFSLDLLPLGQMGLATEPSDVCDGSFEFFLACNQVDVVWNALSGEFGVLYNEGPEKTLVRVLPSGEVASRTSLGLPPLYGALAVNSATGSYLVVSGGRSSLGFSSTPVEGAELSPNGVIVGRGVITSQLNTWVASAVNQLLSYSPASGTFLLLGTDEELTSRVRAFELNSHGVPQGTLLLRSRPFVVASHPTSPEWIVPGASGTDTLGTRTRFGGSGEMLPGCVTPDPFRALGGGTCYNRGWLPPGIPPPAPPTTVPGGCVAPDPFAALGGGTCVNGGWLPPGISPPGTLPPPPPSPPGGSAGCLTPDPFLALGGGTCVNGGWLPPGMQSPAPPSTGCTTPDPFVAIGGGVCVNGGWRPRSH